MAKQPTGVKLSVLEVDVLTAQLEVLDYCCAGNIICEMYRVFAIITCGCVEKN
jgi:hypothetical protein